MKLLAQVRRTLMVGATIGLLMPPMTFGGDRVHPSSIRDVALQQAGTLRGEALSAQGPRVAGTPIAISTDGEIVADAVVGANGKFAVSGLRPGVYSVVVGDSQSIVRLWSEAAAPPVATSELILVDQQQQIVRGELGHGFLPRWNHPVMVNGLLLTVGVIGGVIGYNIRDFDPAS